MTPPVLEARSAFHGLLVPAGSGRGVIVSDCSTVGLTSVEARRGRVEALDSRLAGNPGAMKVGPRTWWVLGNPDLAGVEEIASIVDQSDAYAILRLTGPRVRDALAKLVFIDLHPEAFKPGDVASTVAAHMGATLWRLDDGADGAVFEIACYRSFASSLWHALATSAAEFGLAP